MEQQTRNNSNLNFFYAKEKVSVTYFKVLKETTQRSNFVSSVNTTLHLKLATANLFVGFVLTASKNTSHRAFTAQKMKFLIKDFFSKCHEIRRKLWIWSHLLKRSVMQNFIFCAKFGESASLFFFNRVV